MRTVTMRRYCQPVAFGADPSEHAQRHFNDVMWKIALEQAHERFPDYRFYRVTPERLWAAEEAPDPDRPQLRGVHVSYLTWPVRDSFSYDTEPLSADDVLARIEATLECVEEDPEELAGRPTQARRVTLTANGRSVRDTWDMSYGDRHPFDKPWPPTAAQVLEERAREAAQVDDGRSADEWLLTLPDPRDREHWLKVKQLDSERDAVAEHVQWLRDDAWKLYRLLGPELYERLVAGYRAPLAAGLYANEDAAARADAHRHQLKITGRRLREARAAAGLSIEQARELTGLPKARIVDTERGHGTLKVSELITLAALYRVPADTLLAAPDPPADSGQDPAPAAAA